MVMWGYIIRRVHRGDPIQRDNTNYSYMKYLLQRGIDSIHWPPRALGIRHVIQPNPPASRTLVAPGLPRHDVLAPPPATATSLHPELSSGDGDFALVACVAAVFAILVFWMKKARTRSLRRKIPRYLSCLELSLLLAHAANAADPFHQTHPHSFRFESQRQGSAAWSIQVCVAPTASASAAPLPLITAKYNPSHLARLHAVPLGLDHPGFDYKDLDWRSFLGAGGFGTVYKAVVRHTKREITVKCVRHWTERGYERILDELALARVLGQSPWYAELYGAFCTWDRVFIAMEFHSGGTLLDYIWNQGGRLHPRAARFYAAELLVAVSHAHALGIMHRDIKPDNILLDKTGHIVIIDMGIAVRFGAGDDAWTAGAYVAQGLRYDTRVDCFAWGVTLYYMLTGTVLPYPALADSKGQPIGAGGLSYYDINNDAHIGYWERDLLAQALAHRIQDRPTFSQTKSHPYWVGLDWAKVEQRLANPPPARGVGCPRLERRLRTRRQTMA
ncbi:kinase-like domain-containing protein [Infundibulicybe gibba]|nr:kinase-like domain-containing protein [Infundibulicybe gibba]